MTRVYLAVRLRALRASALPLVQTAVAASLAWVLAHDLLGHQRAFFAPIAAVIALGLAPGRRTRRVAEMVLGVALGIAVGDLLIGVIGTGAWQIGLAVLIAMTAGVLLGGGPLPVTQAAASAVLVATLAPPSQGIYTTRAIDALVGGAVGLAVLAVVPGRPLRAVRRLAMPVFEELAGTLEDVARGLRTRDATVARAALGRARAIDAAAGRLWPALDQARETAVLAPVYWRARGPLERYAAAAEPIELVIGDVRAVARSALRAVELHADVPEDAVAAVEGLAWAVRGLQHALEGGDADEPRERAVRAAQAATRAAEPGTDVAVGTLVGELRSLAADLLAALGLPRAEAVSQLRSAIDGRPAPVAADAAR